jgi:hypothetical protein
MMLFGFSFKIFLNTAMSMVPSSAPALTVGFEALTSFFHAG